MMRHFASTGMRLACATAIGLWAGGAAGPAGAQDVQTRPVVVEMFTSQGCSACPPADAFFAEIADDPGVIALSLHVDYWDYIGWEDRFANPRFTERQKAYARAVGSRTIYTPQLVVGGTDRIEGFDPAEVMAQMMRHMALPPVVTVQVARTGDRLVVTAEADPPLTRPVRVQLVRYMPQATVTIERGENAGRTVTYRNIVTAWEDLGGWPGQAPATFEAEVAGDDPAVVILQEEGPAAILAAARAD